MTNPECGLCNALPRRPSYWCPFHGVKKAEPSVPVAVLADLHARHAADAGTTFARLLNDLGSLIGDAQYEPDDDRGEDQR